MERSDDDEEGAELSVTPDGTDSQSEDLDEAAAEQQQTTKKTRTDQSEDAAERAERRIHEDEILERARAIEKARVATSKACPHILCQLLAAGTDRSLQRCRLVLEAMQNKCAALLLPACMSAGSSARRRS